MIRRIRWLVLATLVVAATVGGATGCGVHKRVAPLSLHDPRLPIEARKWLADAEDEVAIARARVDEAEVELARLKAYRRDMVARVAAMQQRSRAGGSAVAADDLKARFNLHLNERIELADRELDAARKALSLSRARLTLARAETAIRHDVAVYEIEPLALEVESLRQQVAAAERRVEEQRQAVDETAAQVWSTYARYVDSGGETNALWGMP